MSDLFDVSREVILITGASQGLGRQFARVLSAHGAAVALAARQTGKLKALEDEIKAKGGRAVAVEMDVTSAASIAKGLDAAESALGPITVLINNAGIAVEKLAVEQSEADWDAVIGANLKGAYFAATEVARRMIARKGGGNIINIASVLGFSVVKFIAPYAISKAGVVQATKALALELAASDIRVNALAPGAIDTPLLRRSFARHADPEPVREASRLRHAMKRFGEADEVAAAALFLASDEASFTTGIVLPVDGGWLAA